MAGKLKRIAAWGLSRVLAKVKASPGKKANLCEPALTGQPVSAQLL
jgi:hypothetical protein